MEWWHVYLGVGAAIGLFVLVTEREDEFKETVATLALFAAVTAIYPLMILGRIVYWTSKSFRERLRRKLRREAEAADREAERQAQEMKARMTNLTQTVETDD